MSDRIIEIAQDNRHLCIDRGFMLVMEKSTELGRIPLDSISAVIANAYGITYSNNFLTALSKLGIPLVICGPNHMPVGFLWSLDGNYYQAGRMDAQLKASKPLMKQLWKQIVQAKITQQAAVLDILQRPSMPLKALVGKVTSGDSTNIEALAAKRYWHLAFGADFKRDREASGANSMLNYGYTILRATTARTIIAAGLHPTLGIYHKNSGNPMRLADDLMEPFRPIIDYAVLYLLQKGHTEINNEVKKTLVDALQIKMLTKNGASETSLCVQNLASSLGKIFVAACQEENSEQILQLDLPITIKIDA